jgi:hypothetical protein
LFKRDDWIFGLISTLLGVAVIYFSRDLKAETSLDPAGPAAMPVIIACMMIAIGIVHIIGAWRIIKKGPAAVAEKKKGDIKKVAAICAACLIYYLLLDVLGYPVLTPFLIMAIMGSVGVRDLKHMIGMSIGTTAVLFCIFYFLLKVSLPLGILSSLAD